MIDWLIYVQVICFIFLKKTVEKDQREGKFLKFRYICMILKLLRFEII